MDANRDTPIGYKGIGFRSILTLTDSPEIHSGHLHVRWAPEIARNALDVPSLPPAIVLALPQWCPNLPGDFTDYNTVIRLPLSIEQPDRLKGEWKATETNPSLLVFIDGVEEVRWESRESIRLWQRKCHEGMVDLSETVDGQPAGTGLWRIHNSGAAIVAVGDRPDGSFMSPPAEWTESLRSFFPTEVPNPFPNILVHGAFPLSPDRKHIDDQHEETQARVTEAAEVIAAAVATRPPADALDILFHTVASDPASNRIQARLCEAVKLAVRVNAHAVTRLRSCPARAQLPYQFKQNEARLKNWEDFKCCLSQFRRDGIDGLHLLPLGCENEAREKTLLWLNPDAPITTNDLSALPWAPAEKSSTPVASASPPLFEWPRGDARIPEIPDGFRLHFLDRAFRNALYKRLGETIASAFLRQSLGVLPFTLLGVVERVVLPAVTHGTQPEDTITFLQELWRQAGEERERPFDWKEHRRAQLIRSCKVVCRDGVSRPALEVYAGHDWTGSDFIERAYENRSDRAFLHHPPSDPGE